MSHVLFLYATRDGHTRTISEYVAKRCGIAPNDNNFRNLNDFLLRPTDLMAFDVIVLGASVRYGSHHASVQQFIETYSSELQSQTFAFFSVNLTARSPEKATPETSRYTQKLYQKISVKPDIDAVFAGRLDYPSYRFFDRHIIRLIMTLTGGPTAPDTVKTFTDWEQVNLFADRLTTN